MGRSNRFSSLLVLLITFFALGALASAQKPLSHEEARAIDHQNPAWDSIRAHLPDTTTASAQRLEAAADVLRGHRISSRVRMLVVPGSEQIKRDAEREGLHETFKAAPSK